MNFTREPYRELVAGYADDVQTNRRHQISDVGAWRGKQVPTQIQPVIAARQRIETATQTVGLLEQQHAAITQLPGRRHPGRATADHDDIVLAFAHWLPRPECWLCSGIWPF